MKRSTEIIIGIVLFSVPLTFLLAIKLSAYFIIGAILSSFLILIGYKLIRYPSKRETTIREVGEVVSKHYDPLFLCFSGIDGSGKTTHAESLKEKLLECGIPCEIVWTRWSPIITYPFMGLVYILKRYRRKDYHKSKILNKIWAYLTILDYMYIYLTKIKPSLRKGILICDRYVYDHIAELMRDGLYNEKAEKILLRLVPNPSQSFIFDVPSSIALMRKSETRDMLNTWNFDISAEEYLSAQRENYLQIAKKLEIPIIDTTKEFTSLNNKIYERTLLKYVSKL